MADDQPLTRDNSLLSRPNIEPLDGRSRSRSRRMSRPGLHRRPSAPIAPTSTISRRGVGPFPRPTHRSWRADQVAVLKVSTYSRGLAPISVTHEEDSPNQHALLHLGTNARPASSSFRSASEQAVSELVESAAHGDRGHDWKGCSLRISSHSLTALPLLDALLPTRMTL